jgi:hypothetical protein
MVMWTMLENDIWNPIRGQMIGIKSIALHIACGRGDSYAYLPGFPQLAFFGDRGEAVFRIDKCCRTAGNIQSPRVDVHEDLANS